MESRDSETVKFVTSHWASSNVRQPVEIARFMSKFGDGQMLSVVIGDDGSYDILRNGVSIAARPWKSNELEDCLEALSRLTGCDSPTSAL